MIAADGFASGYALYALPGAQEMGWVGDWVWLPPLPALVMALMRVGSGTGYGGNPADRDLCRLADAVGGA